MKQICIIACVLLLCVGLAGCDDDPKRPRVKRTDPDPIDLTKKWHVIYNLCLAYNERNITEYQRIFDRENFVFFFYEGDVGGSIPEQWGYAEETTCAQNMFSGAGGVEDNPILSIDLTLFDVESAQWVEVDPGDDFPGETWYQTIVVYKFEIGTANITRYVTTGSPTVAFTVRQIDGKWKLVQWRDRSSSAAARVAPAGVEPTSWSKLKALY
jgi:hypothetical protein